MFLKVLFLHRVPCSAEIKGGEMLEQLSQGGHGCPFLGGVQGQVVVSPPITAILLRGCSRTKALMKHEGRGKLLFMAV